MVVQLVSKISLSWVNFGLGSSLPIIGCESELDQLPLEVPRANLQYDCDKFPYKRNWASSIRCDPTILMRASCGLS